MTLTIQLNQKLSLTANSNRPELNTCFPLPPRKVAQPFTVASSAPRKTTHSAVAFPFARSQVATTGEPLQI